MLPFDLLGQDWINWINNIKDNLELCMRGWTRLAELSVEGLVC